MQQINSNRKLRPYLEYFLPFYTLFSQYNFGGISLTMIALALIILLNGKISLKKSSQPYLALFGYVVFRDVLHMVLSTAYPLQTQFHNMLEYIILIVLVSFVSKPMDESALYKSWIFAGLIYSGGLLYHLVQLYIFRNPVHPISIIPGYVMRVDQMNNWTRPMSFFVEPGGYAASMLVLLFLSLKRRNLKIACVSSLLILASTSTAGVASVAILWLLYFFQEKKSASFIIRYAAIVCVIAVVFFTSSVFEETLLKTSGIVEGEGTFRSRIAGPFEVIFALNPLEWIFGTESINVKEFVISRRMLFPDNSVAVSYLATEGEMFLNTIASFIFQYGLIGLVMLITIFLKRMKNKHYGGWMYAVMMFITLLFQNHNMNYGFFLIMLFFMMYDESANDMQPNDITESSTRV